MLELKNISKRFGDVTAVNNLSLKVEAGEIVGLIGENGSGKTTTLKMIAGLYEPSFGQILVLKQDISRTREIGRAMIGYIPDEPAIYDKLTGDEFLHFVIDAFRIPEEIAQEKMKKLKNSFPMPGQTFGTFSDYSRGTRQKFMIMGALLHDPPLLLVDEPIVGLDPKSAEEVVKIFTDYVSTKKHAILLCTHTLSVAQKLCSRFVIIKNGAEIASGTLEKLRKTVALPNGSLEEIYLKLNQ